MNKNVENNLYIKCNITQISMLDSHYPGPKQEVGKRNSRLFLPLSLSLSLSFFFLLPGNVFR